MDCLFFIENFFKEYNISQQIILKLVVFCASILFSYLIFYFTREKERKNVKALLPSSSRRYEMIFKPVSARKQVFDAYIFSVPIIACLVLYLSINDGGEGIVLVINSIISFFLLSFYLERFPFFPLIRLETSHLKEFEKLNKAFDSGIQSIQKVFGW